MDPLRIELRISHCKCNSLPLAYRPMVLLCVLIAWQFAHTKSHFAISSNILFLLHVASLETLATLSSFVWSKPMHSGGKIFPQSTHGSFFISCIHNTLELFHLFWNSFCLILFLYGIFLMYKFRGRELNSWLFLMREDR